MIQTLVNMALVPNQTREQQMRNTRVIVQTQDTLGSTVRRVRNWVLLYSLYKNSTEYLLLPRNFVFNILVQNFVGNIF